MDADTSEKIRKEAVSDLAEIIQQEIAKAKLNGALRGYACESDEQFDELLAELSQTLKEES